MSPAPSPEPPPENLRVQSATEIAAYLTELQREQIAVLLNSPGGHALPSQIRTFNPAADLLAFEIGNDPDDISQHLVAGGEISATAYLGSVKLQFDLESPVLVNDAQGSVLRSTLPQRLYRFQRRQAFRVQPAGSLFPRVLLPVADGSQLVLRVLDISVGGLALQFPPEATPPEPGTNYRELTLELDRTTQLRIGLDVQHVSPWRADGVAAWQVGGAFTELNAAVTRALQLYVDQTQKRRRMLKLDL
jgi:c-di-GMP-binding flagellar brake protein YcgR